MYKVFNRVILDCQIYPACWDGYPQIYSTGTWLESVAIGSLIDLLVAF